MLSILIILIILALNLLAVFTIKSRINRIICIIIANLITILLYCLKIDNFVILQKLIIATIIFCAAIFYIFSKDQENQLSDNIYEKSKIQISLIVILTIISAALSFYVLKNTKDNLLVKREILINSKITKSEIAENKIQNNKTQFLYNMSYKNSPIINEFSNFLIIICTFIAFLSLKINHKKE